MKILSTTMALLQWKKKVEIFKREIMQKNDIDIPRIHHEALCRLDEHKSISEKKCYVEVKVDGVTYHVYFNKVEGGWVPEKTERK